MCTHKHTVHQMRLSGCFFKTIIFLLMNKSFVRAECDPSRGATRTDMSSVWCCCVTGARRDQIQPEQLSQVLSENNGAIYICCLCSSGGSSQYFSAHSSGAAAVSSFNRKPRGSLKTPTRLRPPPRSGGTASPERICRLILWKKNTFFSFAGACCPLQVSWEDDPELLW